ncbi:EAL domain-containing protein [Ectothiorhodospiraceae bacterium BW-2]|nr:EAL domain-containing protein [Ectothiorhodospiraceae bacterium BW-2]
MQLPNELTILFQPIVMIHQQTILGYEAFIRGPANSPYINPQLLFEQAQHQGREAVIDLEIYCHLQVIKQFVSLELPGKLFLNSTLFHHNPLYHYTAADIVDIAAGSGLHREKLVVELKVNGDFNASDTEHQIALCHQSGIQLSLYQQAYIDKLTAYQGEMPDYIKFNRHLINDIAASPERQQLLQQSITHWEVQGAPLIAEGVESRDDFRYIANSGIAAAQGYYFSRPSASPPRALKLELFCTSEVEINRSQATLLNETVAILSTPTPSVPPDTLLNEVEQLFRHHQTLQSIPVVTDTGQPLGLVRRQHLYSLFALQYGRSLYAKNRVTTLIDEDTVTLDAHTPITEASSKITAVMQQQVESDFIITERGRYLGIGKVIELLRRITELQVRNAHYANPLTLLPGNVPIYEHFEGCVRDGMTFVVAYCDLDHFKPFNDIYGYSQGDGVIRKVAEILLEHSGSATDFVGHVGGDDFIIIFRSIDWKRRCHKILERFAASVAEFYASDDYQRGGFYAKSRQGEMTFYHLLSLSIGAVEINPHPEMTHHDISTLTTEAKKGAKAIAGNSLYVRTYTKAS